MRGKAVRRFIWAGALALAVGAAPAGVLAIQMTPELQKIVEAAKREGGVVVTMADEPMGGTTGAAAGEAGMNKMFGTNIKVRYIPGPPYAEQGAKLLTEMQARQPAHSDVYISTAVQFTPLWKQGLFRPVEWAKLYPERIKPFMAEGDNRALRVYTALPGVLYNKRFEPQVLKTQTLQDFLKPEWKGKFVTTPYLAAFDVLVSREGWGPEKTEEYVRALSGQIGGMLGCGSADRVASGEMPVLVVDCSGGVPFQDKYKAVLGLHVLPDIAQRRYGYLSIPANAPNPNAAILYLLYWASPEGQRDLFRVTGYDMADFEDSQRRPLIRALEGRGYKFKDVTVAWWESQADVTENHRKLVRLLVTRAKR